MNNEIVSNDGGLPSVVFGSQCAILPNVSIEYMYRDASNYKCYEVVSFSNPQKIGITEIRRKINDALSGLMLFPEQLIFRPEWVGLPTVFLFEMPGYQRNDDDHDWHELIAVEETDDSSTVGVRSNISDFIELLRTTHSTTAKK